MDYSLFPRFGVKNNSIRYISGSKGNEILVASYDNNIKLVKYLLKNGYNINKYDSCGYTALIYAIRNINIKIVKYLIDNGANIHFETRFEDFPIHHACDIGNLKILYLLLENNKDININDIDETANTPLMICCKNGYYDCIKYLIYKGADMRYPNYHETPIISTIENEYFNCTKLLLSNGVSIDNTIFKNIHSFEDINIDKHQYDKIYNFTKELLKTQYKLKFTFLCIINSNKRSHTLTNFFTINKGLKIFLSKKIMRYVNAF